MTSRAAKRKTAPEPAHEVFRRWLELPDSPRQVDVAVTLGVSAQTVWRIASGVNEPSGRVAAGIERLTGGAVMAASWWPE